MDNRQDPTNGSMSSCLISIPRPQLKEKVPCRAIKQEKDIKDIQIGKEEVKWSDRKR